jgi:hypothetical protein
VGDHCESGACIGLPVACDDGNPCTDDVCDGMGGCSTTLNTADCDDGDPCTVKDTCFEGTCAGFSVDCGCTADADCAKLDDGDLCNGTLFCDTSKLPFQCAVKEGSFVSCPAPTGSDAVCKKAVCEPATGKCLAVPDHDGYACEDGNACTIGDQCQDAGCSPGVALACADNNPCTDDACDTDKGCVFSNNAAPCSDGDVCTTGDQCLGGVCKPGLNKECDDGNPCTDDACDPVAGCVHSANAAACDDDNACTVGDHCSKGTCTFDEIINCADTNPCTTDTCDGAAGCIYTLNTLPCDDGDACTANDTCQAGTCVPGKPANCNDGNVCTNDFCDPATGCAHTINTLPCDDGNVCTTKDTCSAGQCKGGPSLSCTDSNPCTDDGCSPETGCEYAPNAAPCDDGNVCTAGDVCTAGACAPGAPLNCDDKNQCTMDLCSQPDGCKHLNISGPCDDGDACTANTICKDGVCGNGIPFICEDNNPCTDNLCDKKLGCNFAANQAPCDDKNACTTGDVCGESQCKPGAPVVCNDNQVCTDDACVPATGCAYTPVADLTVCGTKKHCEKGLCVDDCSLVHGSISFAYSGNISSWTVPDCVTSVTIETWGAQGGKNNPCSQQGGKGARMKGTFTVTPKEVLKVVVGGKGLDRGSDTANQSGTGGGGSFVWKDAGTQLLIAAGGGGGGAICTSGGDPNYATGRDGVTDTSGTKDTTNTYSGGTNGSDGDGQCPGKGWNNVKNNPSGYGSGGELGGYGGGGTVGSNHGGGGGGGYSGGGGKAYIGNPAGAGGGGGSFNSGSAQSNSAGVQTGNGKVEMTW